MSTESYFELTPNGIRRVTIERGGFVDPTPLLRNMARDLGEVVHDLIPGIHVRVTDKLVSLSKEITELPILTYWGLDDRSSEPVFVPKFEPSPDHLRMRHIWKPPFRVLFTTAFFKHRDSGGLLRYSPESYCAIEFENQSYRLPLPNIFADSRACLGVDGETFIAGSRSLLPEFERYLDIFLSGEWNADLLDEDIEEVTRRLIRFSPDGEPLPPVRLDFLSDRLTPISVAATLGVFPLPRPDREAARITTEAPEVTI